MVPLVAFFSTQGRKLAGTLQKIVEYEGLSIFDGLLQGN